MKKSSLIQSRFRGVYLGLAIFWLALSLGFLHFNTYFVTPKMTGLAVREVESIVLAQRENLSLLNTRPLRDELVRQKFIQSDTDFEILRPAQLDPADNSVLTSQCVFVTPSTCKQDNGIVIFDGPQEMLQDPARSNFAVVLKTSIGTTPTLIWILNVFVPLLLAAIILFCLWGVRLQEKLLVGKLRLLTESIGEIEESFGQSLDPEDRRRRDDEFIYAADTLKETSRLLKEKIAALGDLKRKYAAQARVEMLSATIAYTSHDLKAPLEEAADFLENSETIFERMPKELVLKAMASLNRRLRRGLEDFNNAITRVSRDIGNTRERVGAVDLFSRFAKRNNQKLKPGSQPEIEVKTDVALAFVTLAVDRIAIESVLWNLLSNSRRVTKELRAEISVRRRGEHVVADYRDNGPGVPDARLELIFDDFVSFSGGSGLGLPSARRIIETHGGAIRAVSSVNGAHFEITLPISEEEASELPLADSTSSQGEGGAHA